MGRKKIEYNDSEENLMYSFEKFFLFEFYVRNLRLNQSKEFENLLQLKVDIQEEFIELLDLDKDQAMIQGLVISVLNYLQFNSDLSLLKTELDLWNISDKQLTDIVDVYKKFENIPKIKLVNRFYRFSDLVYSNNIFKVIRCWDSLFDERIRRELKLDGKFGQMGKTGNEWTVFDFQLDPDSQVYSEINFPNVLKFKRGNYSIYSSNYDAVTINNETQLNSLVLSISTDKNADNIDKILEEFRSIFVLLQSQSNWDKLCPDIDQTTDEPTSIYVESLLEVPESRSYIDIIKEKRKTNQLIKRYDNIYKMLLGLHCYDINVENAKNVKKKTLEESAFAVIDHLKELKYFYPPEKKTIILSYYDVKKNIDDISIFLENSSKQA